MNRGKKECSIRRWKIRERSGARRARARWHDVTVDEAKKRTPRWRLERSKWPRKRKRRRGKEGAGGEGKGRGRGRGREGKREGTERGEKREAERSENIAAPSRRRFSSRPALSRREVSPLRLARAWAEWSRGEPWWPRVLKEIARRPSRLSAERGSGIQSTRSVVAHSGR